MRFTERFDVITAVDKCGIERHSKGIKCKSGYDEKLCQLEDIEEELGIDLIILSKAFKNGCYGIQNGKIYKMNIVRLDNQDKESIILFRNKHYSGECYLLKEYGKTWALTKEEFL